MVRCVDLSDRDLAAVKAGPDAKNLGSITLLSAGERLHGIKRGVTCSSGMIGQDRVVH